MSTFSLALSVAILVICLAHVSTSASISITARSGATGYYQRLTCRHQDEAKKKVWKTCVKTRKSNLIPSYKDLRLQSIFSSGQMDIPPNSFRCFAVQRFAKDASLNMPSCPAVCKLYNPKKKNGCEVGDDLLNTAFTEKRGISVVKSPRYGCSNYSSSEICIYNVQMPCKGNGIFLSKESSEMDLAEGDSIEIFHGDTHYHPMTGSGIEGLNIQSSDFLLLFLSEKDGTQNAGFKLQFECPEEDDDEEMEGSAELNI